MDVTSDTTKILEKGPEYLRKQMELESETKGRMSAVERLAASKPKYVKSHQVASSAQESVISLISASVSSTGPSVQNSNSGEKPVTRSNTTEPISGTQYCSPVEVRRSSSKKRPDSLLLYRQKCELLRGSGKDRKQHARQKMLLNSVHKNVLLPEMTDRDYEITENGKKTTPEGAAKECSLHVNSSQPVRRKNNEVTEQNSTGINVCVIRGAVKKTPGLLAVLESEKRSGRRVSRSQSDISSRYSKNFADFDAFFKYCGLSGEVVESLGKENFSARSDEIAINVRSVSVSTSDSGFTRNSDDIDGLLEEELHENIHQGTSIIERNARIIKWLYSCKNVKEAGKKLRDLD